MSNKDGERQAWTWEDDKEVVEGTYQIVQPRRSTGHVSLWRLEQLPK